MKRFFILASIFCIFSYSGVAQGLRLGLTTAISSDIILDNGIKSDPRYQATFSHSFSPIGLNVSYDLTPSFGLSLETIMANQEAVYQIIDIAEQVKGEHKLDMSMINVPVLLRFMSSGTSATRFNFNVGPQFSFITKAIESVAVQSGEFQIPEGATFEEILQDYPTASQNTQQATDGTYEISADYYKDVLKKEANEFRNMNFQIALAMGLDIDVAKHFIVTTQIRANYSIDGYRNEDAFNDILNGNANQVFAEKANLNVGIQLGVQYSLNVTRSRR